MNFAMFQRLLSSTAFGDIARFDPEFYKDNNPDLHHCHRVRDLYRHYMLYGRVEGRHPTRRAMIAALEAKYGKLPPDFNAKIYISLYSDLKKGRYTEQQAVEHYLRFGREEGRAYILANSDLFRELYLDKQTISDRDIVEILKDKEFIKGKLITGADVMRAKGLNEGGKWIEAIKSDEFALLNFGWAGSIGSRMEAVDAVLSRGISRLAPLSLSLDFDAEFYRDANPSLSAASDEACYRDWLFRGLEAGCAGSPKQFFADLDIQLETFPSSFQWRRYKRSTRDLARGSTRWSALRHFILGGFARNHRFISGADAANFLRALGDRFHENNATLSVKALELARRLEPLDNNSLRLLADGYFSLRKWEKALDAYDQSVRGAGASAAPASIFNAARAALELDAFERAFDILRDGKAGCAGAPNWRKTMLDAIEAEFTRDVSNASDLIKEGRRALADKNIAEAVARVSTRFATLDPIGLPLPTQKKTKVVILAELGLPQCKHYRVDQKQELLEALAYEYEIFAADEADAFISSLPGASAAIFYRLPASPMTVRAIEVARALGVPTYYDIDDLNFDAAEYPEPYETYGSITRGFYESLQLGVPLARAAMALCDYGVASTTYLAARMRPIMRKREVFVLPNGLDRLNAPFLDAPPRRQRRDDSVIVFYGSGTKAHNSDFMRLAAPALVSLMTENPLVKLMIAGYLTLDASFDAVRNQIIRVGWLPDLNSYWSLLAEADINIAVLAPFATTDSKSEIKWLEAAAMSIPSVVSGTARYREVLEDGVDVLIADDAEGWASALRRLAASPALRAQIAARAKEKAAAHYSIEVNARRFAAILSRGAADRRVGARPKRRVLLVNLFFHPQSLGGSPRVVRDNLDRFLDGPAREEFEFAVATTDFGGEGLNQIRVENYRDCPVFRVSPEPGMNSEWQPELPRMGVIFSRLLDIWRPDLVHFHCIQRFSGSIVERCIQANIPYVVTAHDAWWISDWQFLTDAKDRLRDPREPIPFDPPEPVTLGAAMERRRFLTPLLKRAQAILCVSRTFAEVYRSCGFSDAIAVPNGVPPLAKAARVPSESGRVRLTHIGGRTKFKGYGLIEAAFKQSRFSNLELTVVDETRYGGREYRQTWGATPVRIVGKTVSEQMHEYYARHDVLLAPSLWPEPFGLVTREALAAGLWVIAGDRGAIGEDVAPGVNGWVVDVSTPRELLEALSQIDADPKTYLKSPPPTRLRASSEQADELLGIYRRVIADPRSSRVPYERATVGRPDDRVSDLETPGARASRTS